MWWWMYSLCAYVMMLLEETHCVLKQIHLQINFNLSLLQNDDDGVFHTVRQSLFLDADMTNLTGWELWEQWEAEVEGLVLCVGGWMGVLTSSVSGRDIWIVSSKTFTAHSIWQPLTIKRKKKLSHFSLLLSGDGDVISLSIIHHHHVWPCLLFKVDHFDKR